MRAVSSSALINRWRISSCSPFGIAKQSVAVAALQHHLLVHRDRRHDIEGQLALGHGDRKRALPAAFRADADGVSEMGDIFTTTDEHEA